MNDELPDLTPSDRIGLWLVAVLCAAAWAAIFGVGYLVGRVVG